MSDLSVDSITAEIVRNAVVAITDEMKTSLMRTAYNMIIYEALDFTVGLFDHRGDTISIRLGLPMFIRGLSDAIKAKLDRYTPEGIEPGNILLTSCTPVNITLPGVPSIGGRCWERAWTPG